MSAERVPEIPDSFEARIERLEEIVALLERGEEPLERTLELFEEGIRLARACQEQVTAARRRVEVLLEAAEGGAVRTEPFEEGGGA
jgi:exodeoxyribonuclease VII small subunit